MKIFSILTTATIVASYACSIASVTVCAQTASVPVLVELFTSEGCSSCPPADVWLQQLDASQPIAGAQLIVLSEHVDYWDHDGWKDPHSSSSMTDRQKDYVRAMGLSSPYTPQVVVDGNAELHLAHPDQVNRVLLEAAKSVPVHVTIAPINFSGSDPARLETHIEVDGSAASHSAEIYAAIALDHVDSQVLKGENGGRHLTHVAVVQEMMKVGKLEKGKTFSRNFQSGLPAGASAKNLRFIVFVQEPDAGRVVGAALERTKTSGDGSPRN